jgi:cobalt-zinc-cadmium efflux system outer membrane protein
MRISFKSLVIGLASSVLAGCSSAGFAPDPVVHQPAVNIAASPVMQAEHFAAERDRDEELATLKPLDQKADSVGPTHSKQVGLPELIALALERNPRLAQVGWAVETARGRAIQAGLYPNPTVSITGDELGDRTGPAGIWTAPMVSQEIVTANKLELSKAAALKEVDQATLAIIAERYRVFTEVRQAFFEAVALQRRVEILTELVQLMDRSVETTEKLRKAKEAARLDVVQLEVDRERYRAELESTRRSLPAPYRKLAASVGVQDLPISSVAGQLDAPPPDYDLERVRAYVVSMHPELRSAQIGVERAQLLVRRAEAEPIPNVTVSSGYTRQSQNKSNDWNIGVSVPVPLWNRNQGNILAAAAQVGDATSQVGRVQNDLVNRLATSFGGYSAARERSERYKTEVLPRSQDANKLASDVYKGGQFEYLRVLQAQRSVAETNLEYLKSLGDMWRSAAEVAGLMLEDQWPLEPTPAPESKQP